MDSIDPVYPPFSSSSESNGFGSQDQARIDIGPGNPRSLGYEPSHPVAAPGPSSVRFPTNLAELPHPEPHLYSPTRAEIESHPVRQRLSLARDEISAGYQTAPEATSENGGVPLETGLLDSRQAQEGSDRWFDAMSSEAPAVKEGDAVSYAWGAGRPEGTVTQVETNDDVTMETNRGNEVKKQGEPENPAVYIDRTGGSDVVKKASEITIEEKGEKHQEGDSEKKDESEEKKEEEPKEEEKKQENGEPQTGDKRPAEESAEEKKDEETNGEAKKQKTDDKPKENGEQPKKKGRPAKTDADGNPVAKKDTKKRPPKKAATETGEPRRSGRNASKSS